MKAKETFCSYTDFSNNSVKKMSEEIAELKTELDKTRNSVRLQWMRYQQLVSLFSAKLQKKEEETRNNLQMKHIQLTRIIRTLYILESKLRKEQRFLKTTLTEKEALIKIQETEIMKLQSELDKIVNRCVCTRKIDNKPKKSDNCESTNNKPDLISSIGIELLKQNNENSRAINEFEQVANKSQNEENTFVISTLDNYDASLTTLHVRDASMDEINEKFDFLPNNSKNETENNRDAHNENLTIRITDDRLQSDKFKFKAKDDECRMDKFKNNSPCEILKEVTENPNQKLNGPILKCIKEILSQDDENHKQEKRSRTIKYNTDDHELESCSQVGHRPAKPPKPIFKPESINMCFETNIPKMFLRNNTLTVKPLPKSTECHQDTTLTLGEAKWDSNTGSRLEKISTACTNDANYHEDKKPAIMNDESKIVQTVSALLSDSAESEEESDQTSPKVSQMVKKFEGLKSKKKVTSSRQMNGGSQSISQTDSMVFQTNFEEFHLVDKEIESTCEDISNDNVVRLEAEGEENNAVSTIVESTSSDNAKFETFLEVTGLSQKSILTPSRILSNHRNVMKPKDVKYRSRVKAAAISEKYNNGCTATSPTTKYWTEPYL